MLTSPHAATGALIGSLVPHPLLAIPLAIFSHYLLDTVPHWQETLAPYTPTTKTYIRVPIDIVLACGITYLFTQWSPDHTTAIWTGAISANVPDLDSFLVFTPELLKKGIIKTYWDWHCRIQQETDQWFGVWTQVGVIGLSLLIGYSLR